MHSRTEQGGVRSKSKRVRSDLDGRVGVVSSPCADDGVRRNSGLDGDQTRGENVRVGISGEVIVLGALLRGCKHEALCHYRCPNVACKRGYSARSFRWVVLFWVTG